MKKLIFTYSLYGGDDRYIAPMLAMDLSEIRSKFNIPVEFSVSCNIDVPKETIGKLQQHGCTVLIRDFKLEGVGGMFARYLPIFEDAADPVIVRDMDSQIGPGEVALINEWLMSSSEFHIIRSHPLHIYPIMGGLFAIRGDAKKLFFNAYQLNPSMTRTSEYNADQIFLSEKIYPILREEALVHTCRVVYHGENYLKIKNTSGFAGETKIVDAKRIQERAQSLKNRKILILPAWLSGWAIKRPFNKLISMISISSLL
jgi:hypothetical protein